MEDVEYSALGENPKCDNCGKEIKPNENVVQTFAGFTGWIPVPISREIQVGPLEMAVFYDKMMLVHVKCNVTS